jgi:hypothetical protein
VTISISDPEQFKKLAGGKVIYEARFVPGGILVDLGGDCRVLWTGGLTDELYTELRDAREVTVPKALVWTVGLDGGDPTSLLSGFGDVAEFLDRGHIQHFSIGMLLRSCSDAGIECLLDWLLGPDGKKAAELLPVPSLPEATRGSWLAVVLANLHNLTAANWNQSYETAPGTLTEWGMGVIPALEKTLRFVRHPGFRAAVEDPTEFPTYYMNARRHQTDPSYMLYSEELKGSAAWGLNFGVQAALYEALRLSRGEDDESEGLAEAVRHKSMEILFECYRMPGFRRELDEDFQQDKAMFTPAIARFLGFDAPGDLRHALVNRMVAQAVDPGGDSCRGPEPYL